MRLLLAVLMFIVAVFSPWYVTAPLAICYALWRPAYELIGIGVMVDAVYGSGVMTFGMWYTIGAGFIVLSVELMKPHLVFYEDRVH